MEYFTYNSKKYCLIPFYSYSSSMVTDGTLTVREHGEIQYVCNVDLTNGLFLFERFDFNDEDVIVRFAGDSESTIDEILEDLEIDISGMNNFLIAQTI